MNSKFNKSVLKNGTRLLTEHHPHSKSFSVGFWMDVGSRHEADSISGMTHFLEHIVFKGTKNRTAFEIAQSLEAFGGDLNAFTTKEHTCFHGLVLKDDWKIALDVLLDLSENMKFSAKDFKNEKNVIIQEIAMSEDQPDDIIYDYLLERIFHDHPVGRPILGTIKSVHGFKEKEVINYYQQFYSGSNLVISCAGNLNHHKIEEFLNKKLKNEKKHDFNLLNKKGFEKPTFHKVRFTKEKATEQNHVLLALPSATFTDELRMESFIVNSILGGGMTSRLFQLIREEKGIAYSIQSHLHTMVDTGFITVHAACETEKVKQLIDIVTKEIKKLKKNGVSKKEINFFKNQIKGSILLGSEDIENRMNSLAVNELIFKKHKSVKSIQNEIENINFDSVNAYIEKYVDVDSISGLILGPKANSFNKWWN